MSHLDIYTDGSCLLDSGMGGWAYVVYQSEEIIHTSAGSAVDTTNNRMELQGVIEACKYMLVADCGSATILCDSSYVVNGLRDSIHQWKQLGWRRAAGELKNADLWQELYHLFYLQLKGAIHIKWVRGHVGVIGNELADQLAEVARLGCQQRVWKGFVAVMEERIVLLRQLIERDDPYKVL